ncbi:hypothetical protein EP331_10535 [bacterium]|nr:MAG: hypothetical protein EP331_10535 [bacterium]
MLNRRTSFLLIALLFISISCKQVQPTQEGVPAAQVGNAVLFEEEIEKLYPEGYSEEQKEVVRTQVIEQWINQQLLVQEAIRTRISERPEVLKRVQEAQNDVLAQAMREIWLSNLDSLKVTKLEAQTFYEKNKEQFVLQERHIRFRHVQTPDLESSRNAKTELLRGIPFQTVVEKYALEKTNTLTEAEAFHPISLSLASLPDLNRYLHVIGLNEISPIRLLDGRYHFVQLVEERAAGEHPDLEWVLDRITDWLLLEKKRKIINSLERELYIKAEVSNEINTYTQKDN